MNKKLIFNVTGRLFVAVGLLLLIPMIVSLIYNETSYLSFGITAALSLSIGFLITLFTKKFNKVLYAKEGFVIVSLAWVIVSLVGAVPFYISGEIPSYVDAIFETVSGYTTTGASILTDVEALSHGMLFWRSFNHWIGGMGVLVFMMAFISTISDRSIHILRAEMPGPIVGKITPRSKDTSKILYIIYLVLTLAEIVLLWCGDMNLFDSVVYSLGTAGTGGFTTSANGLAGYSAYSQWVITVFMFIFGINFNLFYLILLGKLKTVFKSSELAVYTGIILVSIAMISINISSLYETFSETIRNASFQVVSLATTTGYSSVDFNLWPTFSKGIVFLLLFVGGCAGSTAGGLKIARVMLLFKMIFKEIKKLIHPRSVVTVKFEGKEVDEGTERGVTTYFALYMICILAIFLGLSLEPFDFETNLTAAVTCFNNVGPGLASVGPTGSFAGYSPFSKLLLCFAMLLGRLEIYPLLISVIPSTWRKR